VGKGAAYRAWKRLPKNNGYLKTILEALEKHKKMEQWKRENGRFIPNPATWLNQRRFEDEIEDQMKNPSEDEFIRRMRERGYE